MPYSILINTLQSQGAAGVRPVRVSRVEPDPIPAFGPLAPTPAQLARATDIYAAFQDADSVGLKQAFGDRNRRDWLIELSRAPFYPGEATTELKVFNTQCNRSGGFMTGNCMTNTQMSTYIRGRSQTEANGFEFPLGELRKRDLESLFGSDHSGPGAALFAEILRSKENIDRELIGYKVFHGFRRKEDGRVHRKIHGWVLTDTVGNLVADVVPERFHGPTASVMDQATAAFTHATLGERRVLLRVENAQVIEAAPEVKAAYAEYRAALAAEAARAAAPAGEEVAQRTPGIKQ